MVQVSTLQVRFNMINNVTKRNALVEQYYTQEEFKVLRKKYKLTGKPDAKLAQYKNDAFDKEKNLENKTISPLFEHLS